MPVTGLKPQIQKSIFFQAVLSSLSFLLLIIITFTFLDTDPEVRVLFPALSNFLRSSGSGTGSAQPREDN
jgi:hypothetical protein